MIMTEAGFTSVDQLRAFLSLGISLPKMKIYVKVANDVYSSKCPSDLGDGRYLMSNQYYSAMDYDGFNYVVMAITNTVTKIDADGNEYDDPSGNMLHSMVDLDTQNAWVEYFSVDNFFLSVPEIETEVI